MHSASSVGPFARQAGDMTHSQSVHPALCLVAFPKSLFWSTPGNCTPSVTTPSIESSAPVCG